MTTFRRLLTLASTRGRPGTVLSVGDSAGSTLFVELSMPPVTVVAALDAVAARELRDTLTEWLHDHAADPRAELRGPAPLVAGRIAASVTDAGHCATLHSRRRLHTPLTSGNPPAAAV